MNNKVLTVSPSPHVYENTTVRKLMYGVVIALLPTLAWSVMTFGIGAIIVTLVSVVSCILFEYLIQKFLLKRQPTISDGSALVTGLLLAFNVPANLPVGIIIIGALVSIGIGKMSFGGLGTNPFNPALVGRVFLLISFPAQMTSWPIPKGFNTGYVDAQTGATPLGLLQEKGEATVSQVMESAPSYSDLFYGQMSGSLGEMAGFVLIIGLIILLYLRIISWHIPVSIILSTGIFTGILWLADPTQYADPLFHILTGGLLLGAIFMATDYVSSPMVPKAMWIYGVGIGLLTVIIRVFGSYPEGVSFAILVMNAFVPLLNRYIKPRRFGEEVQDGQ
ncbi:MAG: RnfABCDGE type electron transport complex subunit D [Bacteroidales bacterium]|nr:RnfABCDGE type electron transport complex subunit D [Bacteroidales bacterium]